jgi:hypothetical protein
MTTDNVPNTVRPDFLEASSELLKQFESRARLLDRDAAYHPSTVRSALEALDKVGPSEIGDIIHSLFWHATLVERRAHRFSQAILELHNELRALKQQVTQPSPPSPPSLLREDPHAPA